MAFAKPKLSPVTRIALGLVSLAVSIVLVLALFFGVMPDRIESARKVREVLSESIAQQVVVVLQASDPSRLDAVLQRALDGGNDLRSIGVRRAADGRVIAEAGAHQATWSAPQDGHTTLEAVVVPITADKIRWGDVEVAFTPVYPDSILGWLKYPPVATVLLIALLGFIAFYLYLRRVLEYLDPLAVIPERVRMAYDTFQEAVLVLDKQGRVVLANEAFRRLHPAATENLSGKAASSLAWLADRVPTVESRHPWFSAMQTKQPVTGIALELGQPNQEEALEVIMNCTPIEDGYGAARGCMVIFYDVTALHRTNRKLLQTLDQLAASKQEIEDKNKELEKLATRDPLTGCLNRRALFEAIEPIFRKAQDDSQELCCIMGDIDHFKSFNDRYGHSVGDQVIKAVARTIGSGLREGDLLCRYGGEEFCVFLPGLTTEQAAAITDRLRSQIEDEAGRSIRDQESLTITSSFGISSIRQGSATPELLIDLADQALYHSKKTGRNRVTIWSEAM